MILPSTLPARFLKGHMEQLTLSNGKHMTREGIIGICSDTVTGK